MGGRICGKGVCTQSFAPSFPIFLCLALLPVLGFEGPWHEKVSGVPAAVVMWPLTALVIQAVLWEQ